MRTESFRKINYSLRPAKSVERKMLCEGFSRLYPFQPVFLYNYVGFGSLYFSDFSLVHHLLGICNMTSIEREIEAEPRFNLNKPFKCINLQFGSSELFLPKLEWSQRHIIWLDYDGKLNSEVLADVSTVVTQATSGTMLVVSTNAHPEKEPSEQARLSFARKTGNPFKIADYRLSKLREDLGEKLPFETNEKNLRGFDLAVLLRRVMLNEISEQLKVRNIGLENGEKFQFQPIFNFHYQDGARMLTVGGVLFSENERHLFESCKFGDLPFVSLNDNYYEISVPNLTPREMRHLNSQLPATDYTTLDSQGVPAEDVRKYAEIYRYFPAYHESILS